MARLIHTTNISLDGFIEDSGGRYDWSRPDEEFHRVINEFERPIGTYIYGRRMYETMVYWETTALAGLPDYLREYTEIWRAADKVVISRTLTEVRSARTRIESRLDLAALGRLLESADSDVSIGGADVAGQAMREGLVDELRLFTWPVALGGGRSWLGASVHVDLQLLDTRALASGVVVSRYRVGG